MELVLPCNALQESKIHWPPKSLEVSPLGSADRWFRPCLWSQVALLPGSPAPVSWLAMPMAQRALAKTSWLELGWYLGSSCRYLMGLESKVKPRRYRCLVLLNPSLGCSRFGHQLFGLFTSLSLQELLPEDQCGTIYNLYKLCRWGRVEQK